ncbi:MAG: tRNA lysidine(34) synthetase TilS [Gemmatimonadales bacterium]|nr:tRNA lysidine(34) synthetase TilS [Gemmatimonadales bacterium]
MSGGPDSVALLHLLGECAPARGLELVVAHLDHGIHPDSGGIARQVSEAAHALGYPVLVGRLALGAHASETRARRARLAWLGAARAREGARGVFLAHHADDQAETVLMRVLRGTGPAGLAAMRSRAGSLVRPLLPFRREELARYLRDRGLGAWDDPANRDTRHLRSWLRERVLPVLRERLPDVDARLGDLSRQAGVDLMAWDAVLDVLPGLDARAEEGRISLASGALGALAPGLANRVLRTAARRAGLPLTRAAAGRAMGLVRRAESGRRVDLGAGWIAEASCGRLALWRPAVAPDTELDGAAGDVRWGDWVVSWVPGPAGPSARATWSAWVEPGALSVGALRVGERLRPIGGPGGRLLVRLFQEARVPRGERWEWPVLRREGQAIWLPGVVRSAAAVPVTGEDAVRVDVRRA